jgi:hypothetical protein
MLNPTLNFNHHASFVSLHNPTNRSYSLSKGIILGTTTIPTISSKKTTSTIDYLLVNKYIGNLIQHLDNHERQQVKLVLNHHAKLFDISKPTIANTLKPQIKVYFETILSLQTIVAFDFLYIFKINYILTILK